MSFQKCFLVFIQLSLCTIILGQTEICPSDELPCDSGDECVSRSSWCDGFNDCADESDEKYCKKTTWRSSDPNSCKSTHFLCKSGICVPEEAKCDNQKDCPDGSDESNCPTPIPDVEGNEKKEVDDSDDDDDYDDDDDDENTKKQFSSKEKSTPIPSTSTPSSEENKIDDDFSDYDIKPFVDKRQISGSLTSRDQVVERGIAWLISIRHPNYGWGSDTARALITLGLSKPDYFQNPQNDVYLMKKQLEVVIAVDMLRNRTNPVSLSRLSLYINALLATCQDPNNFHGMNLVKELRHRVSATYSHRESFVNPFVHLTLCFVNQSTESDVHKLMATIRRQTIEIRWHDMKAISVMAMSCIVQNYNFGRSYSNVLHQAVEQLRGLISPVDGSFSNIYSTALLVQALLFANESRRWNPELSLQHLIQQQQKNGSFGDLLATYYILPSVAGQSLNRLRFMPCSVKPTDPDGLTPLDVLLDGQGPRHYVRYSLLYGNPVEVSYSILLHVPISTNFFDIMRVAQHTDPKFKFLYETENDGVHVYSIGNVPNDAERGVYWHLYANLGGRHSLLNGALREVGSNLRPYVKGVKKFIPKDRDHVAFWYKTI